MNNQNLFVGQVAGYLLTAEYIMFNLRVLHLLDMFLPSISFPKLVAGIVRV